MEDLKKLHMQLVFVVKARQAMHKLLLLGFIPTYKYLRYFLMEQEIRDRIKKLA